MNNKRLHIFILVSIVCGWLGVLVDQVLKEKPEGSSLGMLIWLVLPFFTAILLRTLKKDWNNNGFAPHFRGNMKWYGFAVLVYLVTGIIGIIFGVITKSITFDIPNTDLLPGIIITAILGQLLKNVFEEYSWRGYLTQKLVETKLKDGMIYLIVGVVWGTWHVPYYLFFVDKSLLVGGSRVMMILSGYVILIVWSIMYVEIYRITKSIWPCVIMHAITNVIQIVFLGIDGGIKFTSYTMEVLFHPVNGVIATILCVLCGLALRRLRISNNKANINVF